MSDKAKEIDGEDVTETDGADARQPAPYPVYFLDREQAMYCAIC